MKMQVMLAMILAMGVVQAGEALWITEDTPTEKIIEAFQAKVRDIQPVNKTRGTRGGDDRRGIVYKKPQAASQTPQTEASAILVKIQFAYDSAKLDQASRNILDKIAGALVNNASLYNAMWYVAGHTDSRGSEQYNMVLSRRRAEAVRKYLIAQRVAPYHLEVIAYGESSPYDSQNPEAAINRRVEFLSRAQ